MLRASAIEGGGWDVTSTMQGRERTEHYDALLACSGAYWDPRIPDIPGNFEGQTLHAQRYRDPQHPIQLAGKRVVVVGIGNTGCEIACEIAKSGADAVFLSARSGAWILPQYRDGKAIAAGIPMAHPNDPVPGPLRLLPDRAREFAFEAISKRMFTRMFGPRMQRLQELGLPAPPDNPLEKRATVSEPLLDALESGAVGARKGITRFDGSVVEFGDGAREEADVVIFATGYRFAYPYVPESVIPPGAEDLSLFMGTLHPVRRDFFMIGVSRPTGAFWPIAEVHARLAAALLSGEYALPNDRTIRRLTRPILGRNSFNPAVYGLAMQEEIARGQRRARRR